MRVGLSDGTLTEVAGEQIADGLMVVTGRAAAGRRRRPAPSNPFTPSFTRGGGAAGGGRPR